MKRVELEKRENVVNFYRKTIRDIARAVSPKGLIKGEFKLLMYNKQINDLGYKEKNGLMTKWEYLQLSEILETAKKNASDEMLAKIEQAEDAKKMAYTLLEHTF